MFAIVILVLSSLQFLAFALLAMWDPAALLAPLGFQLTSGEALVEARAFYGGAEFALAALMAGAAMKAHWREAGLYLVAAVFLCVGIVRGIGMMVLGASSTFLWIALLVELAFGVLALLALPSTRAKKNPAS